MANQATVDPGLCTIVIAGYTLSGFADGVSFNSTFDVDRFSKTVGNRGLGAFGKTISGSATITLTVLNTSSDNDVLMLIATADNNTPGGVLVPLVKVTGNARITEGGDVRIMKIPDTQDGAGPYPVTWTLGSLNYVKFVGGYEETPVVTSIEELQALIDQAPPKRAAV